MDGVILGDTVTMVFTTRSSTGGRADADSTPTVSVYEDTDSTPIVSATVAKVTGATGLYTATFTASVANGFEVGKSYNVVATAKVGGQTDQENIGSFVLWGQRFISGPYTLTCTVTDGTDPVSGVSLWLKDPSGNLKSPPQQTDANGQVSWTVPDGTWVVYIEASPTYAWDASTKTVTVSGSDTTTSFTGTAWSVPTPSSSEYCVVYGYVKKSDGTVYANQANAVQVTPEGSYRNGNTGETVATVYADTDANGYFSVEVLKSKYACKAGEASGSGTGTYRVEIKSMDLNVSSITIPDASSKIVFDLTHA